MYRTLKVLFSEAYKSLFETYNIYNVYCPMTFYAAVGKPRVAPSSRPKEKKQKKPLISYGRLKFRPLV